MSVEQLVEVLDLDAFLILDVPLVLEVLFVVVAVRPDRRSENVPDFLLETDVFHVVSTVVVGGTLLPRSAFSLTRSLTNGADLGGDRSARATFFHTPPLKYCAPLITYAR